MTLELQTLGDLYGVLPKVEEECRKILDSGKSGKTVSNKVLNLRSMILWAKKRKYLTEDPLEGLAKFDTTPKRIRRHRGTETAAAILCSASAAFV